MVTVNNSHKARVRQELIRAGLPTRALVKATSRYLHNVIHDDEHILAAASGRYTSGSGMLVVTNRRIIFLDHKPGFTVLDEIAYDMISGVKSSHAGLYSSLTLHTRMGDYQLRYVSQASAATFVHFIEQIRVEKSAPQRLADETIFQAGLAMTPEAKSFLQSHDIAVLSSEDRRGNVYGAVIYYLVGQHDKIYMLTRSETAKARNILAHEQVALTIFDADPAQTLQIQGVAAVETDQKTKDEVFAKLFQPRAYKKGLKSPPVTQLNEGVYVIIAITPTSCVYHPYQT